LIADWIRPEDIHHYEQIGYKRFKVTDRNTPVQFLKRRIAAYNRRNYDGNLLDLIQHFAYRDTIEPEDYLGQVYIDNRKLDDFLRPFLKSDCKSKDCGGACRHCFDFADATVSIAPEFVQKHLAVKGEINERKNARLTDRVNMAANLVPQIAAETVGD